MTTAPEPAPATGPARRQGDPKIKSALTRYRVLAYVTGVWLLVLTAEIVYKYVILDDSDSAPAWFFYIGQAHGVFYMLYLVTTIDLAIKVRWKAVTILTTALAGTIPFLSFVAERARTAQVKRDFGV